jgi:hypothetical protein
MHIAGESEKQNHQPRGLILIRRKQPRKFPVMVLQWLNMEGHNPTHRIHRPQDSTVFATRKSKVMDSEFSTVRQ